MVRSISDDPLMMHATLPEIIAHTETGSGVSAPIPSSLRRKLFRHLMPLLTLGFCFCNVDRSNIAFAELRMRSDPAINLTVGQYGEASGVFFAGYALGQLPALHLMQHVGPHLSLIHI